jgi:hypothetical protein
MQETSFKDFCKVVDPRSLYSDLPKSNLNAGPESRLFTSHEKGYGTRTSGAEKHIFIKST